MIAGMERYESDPRISELLVKLETLYADVALPAHGWDHIGRCVNNAIVIGEAESADMNIVVPAMLLHDIGFLSDPDPKGHHLRGAQESLNWTTAWSEDERMSISSCITRHKGASKGFDTPPDSLEQKVVCDADMLEKVGYIGVVQGTRTFVEFGETCWPQYRSLLEITSHLGSTDDVVFYTDKGRELASERGGTELRKVIFKKAEEELRLYYRQ